MADERKVPRVYTGAQQLLRFVSWLYLAWCVVTTAGSALIAVLAFLFGRVPEVPEGTSLFAIFVVSVVTFFVTAAINFFIAILSARCAVHPRLAGTFRIVTIVLTAGSATALVDGQAVELPDGVPAVGVMWEGKESTMVPLRFVSEQLGAGVEWIGETATVAITSPTEETPGQPETADLGQITGLAFDQETQTLTITADHTPQYRVVDLGDRLAIDLLGAVYPEAENGLTLPVESQAILSVRCYQHGDDLGYGYPHTLRVVLDLASGVSYAQYLSVSSGENQVRVTVTGEPEEPEVPPLDPAKITIAIDPGHGGNQPGAVYPDENGEDVQEKDLTLPMSLMLADILEERGYNVVLTRTGDDSVSLADRAKMANAAQAEVFVSIHCNALDRTDYEGIFTYYYPNSTRGEALAKQVQAGVVAATGGIGRGTPSANFQVLRETTMPAVLVETGFMSCPAELARLCDPDYQQQIALGIADGVEAYLKAGT